MAGSALSDGLDGQVDPGAEAGSSDSMSRSDGGSPIVLEAVGHIPAYEQGVGVVRPSGVVQRVSVSR